MWMEGNDGIGVVMPKRRASSITALSPSSMPRRIVGMLRERYRARRSGIIPSYFRS
jgi:hypothetical protein